ncbi:phospholipase [Acuticoccus sediminis]|uniref:Phospholipase n=1 Tax=Acuticoccus sediminis TaxID=2184697 RepID=A0A8B2NY67_9HYPH|nr:dienelactone hydrolase family protein [Acuticoccus sediminis]RAI03650.1 phospholipase [Acuticoccus sediminis]
MSAKGTPGDVHGAGRLVRFGPSGAGARRAVIGLHGRGAGAEDMGGLVQSLGFPDLPVFAPEAAGRTWWPTSFLAPTATIKPHVEAAVRAVDRALAVAEEEGYRPRDIVLLGFSQGGCLALEYAARRGYPFAAVFGLSAGLIGTADAAGPSSADLYGHAPKRFDYDADLTGLPVRISVHAQDPHIPLRRARDSADVFTAAGAAVELAVEPGVGHGLTEGDVVALRAALNA